MLTAFLCGIVLFFAGLSAFLAFDNAMLQQEKNALLRRAQRAEWESAESLALQAEAERDALSANAKAIEAGDKAARLSSHVAALLRQQSQLQSLQLSAPRRFHIEKSSAQKAATRSAQLN